MVLEILSVVLFTIVVFSIVFVPFIEAILSGLDNKKKEYKK